MEIAKGKIGNALTSTASDHVVAVTADIYDEKQERYQEDINEYLLNHANDINDSLCCFSEGIWENNLYWSDVTVWDNNKYALTDALSERINTLSETHQTDTRAINQHLTEIDEELLQNGRKHDAFNTHLEKHDGEIKALQKLIAEHDQQITDLLYALSCFNSGQWKNDFKWSNETLWENSNFMCNTFEDVYHLIEEHRQAITQLIENNAEAIQENETAINDLRGQFGCVEQGEWGNPYFWNNEDLWIDNPNGLVEIETEVIEHNDRITVLEAQFASFMQQFTAQQSIISQQQAQLETLMDCFTVLNVGKWQNLLLWDNTSKWSDALITEVAGDSGVASVAVKSYDPETATVSI